VIGGVYTSATRAGTERARKGNVACENGEAIDSIAGAVERLQDSSHTKQMVDGAPSCEDTEQLRVTVTERKPAIH